MATSVSRLPPKDTRLAVTLGEQRCSLESPVVPPSGCRWHCTSLSEVRLRQSGTLGWECWVSGLVGSRLVVGGDQEGIRGHGLDLLPLPELGHRVIF